MTIVFVFLFLSFITKTNSHNIIKQLCKMSDKRKRKQKKNVNSFYPSDLQMFFAFKTDPLSYVSTVHQHI